MPFGAGDRLRDYFDKYQSSQNHLDAIITALYHGQDELRRDNAAIEQEKVNLWAVMGRLRQYAYLARSSTTRSTAQIAAIEATDPGPGQGPQGGPALLRPPEAPGPAHPARGQRPGLPRARPHPAQQPRADQGRRRATTTTVSALRTAVIVAQALADQKLVLDQITALNTTTANLIESTSEMLHQQSGADQRAGRVGDRRPREAPGGVREHLRDDGRDRHVQGRRRSTAMQKTVTALSTEITKSQAYLDRVRANETRGVRPDRSRGTEPAVIRSGPPGDSRAASSSTRSSPVAAAPSLEPGPEEPEHPDRDGRLGGQGSRSVAGRHQVQDAGSGLVLRYSGTLEGAEAIAGGRRHRRRLVQQRPLPVAPAGAAWSSARRRITRELLEPLAVRLARSGYPTTSTPGSSPGSTGTSRPMAARRRGSSIGSDGAAVPSLPVPRARSRSGSRATPGVLGTGGRRRSG